MSRYTGPRLKKMRALGLELPGLSRKSIERRPYPPGQQGAGGRRRKKSAYGLQLLEKQKIRYNYGVGERQLRRLVTEARASREETGGKLLQLLERRLDNVVYRAGFAPTIPAARQLVNHGHIRLNDHKADIPSMRISAGDKITLRERSKNLDVVLAALADADSNDVRPEWLSFDAEKGAITIQALPDADSIQFELDVQQVIEFYSRMM